jgi:hypothetical protein
MAGLGRKTFSPGDVLTSSDVQGYLMDQSVMVFAGTAARASAIPSPSAGMVAYSTATALQVYNGTAWVDLSTGYGVATGGTSSSITVSSVNYTLLAFTTSSTLTVTKSGLFDFAIVGGGGGGGGFFAVAYGAGGGGASSLFTGTVYLTANQTITVGAKGTGGGNATPGGNGTNSSITNTVDGQLFEVIAGSGGGTGGGDGVTLGGCSGGRHNGASIASIYASTKFGTAGGTGNQTNGGGGGGKTAAGGNGAGTTGGAGGAGYDISTFIGGSATYICGGGGGSGSSTGGVGGSGVGGAGSGGSGAGASATSKGSGGGGSFSTSLAGGNGSDGIVYVRFKV